MFPWLNIELTSRCNRACSFCGRAKKREQGWKIGDIDIELLRHIIDQFPGSIIQFHRDGEPLLYDKLSEVSVICHNHVTNIVSNGLLLWERHQDIKGFDTVCISVIDDNPEQFEVIKRFHENCMKPRLLIKFLGDYYNPEFEKMGLQTTRRRIHNPSGDWHYQKEDKPVIPELFVCQDFLMKPSVDWQGDFYICNRFDPERLGKLGNLKDSSLESLWYGEQRLGWLNKHLQGKRADIPLCENCQFWGVAKE